MNLHDEILQITREYMGIVAESFIARRCHNSLGLENPEKIARSDLDKFARGIAQTGEVYMKAEKVREFTSKILLLKEGELKD